MFTIAEGKKNRAAIMKMIEADHKKEARAKLAALRVAVREAKAHRKEAMRAAVANCRALRLGARARAREERKRASELLKQAAKDDRAAALHKCREGKRAAGDGFAGARARLAAERQAQRELRNIERGNRAARREQKRSTALERRAESDDEVKGNIPPELVRLFEKVKRSIKGSSRESRTEAFLRYAEEHRGEMYAAMDDEVDRRIAELEARQRHAEREVRRTRKKPRGGGGSDVPF